MNFENIRIKNIKVQQDAILQSIFNLALNPNASFIQIKQLAQTLIRVVTTIEKICFSQKATPANLTVSSRKIYSWMKFLTDERHLEIHITSTYRVWQIAKQLLSLHQQESVKVMIEFTNLTHLYKGRISSNTASIIINEGFINASNEVLQKLVESALFERSRDSIQVINSFASSTEYRNVLLELDLIAEVIAEKSQGKFYDLDELFNKLNFEYFAANLAKPRLVWSKINTYRKFGHYEPAKDRVVISLTLDDLTIPEFVTEFVLYHELLHKYHGTKWVNGRRMVHTKEFRACEHKFKLYKEASIWLEKLASGQL